MKKVLVFLLTLGLAASLSAIDLGNGVTVTGEVKAGVKVETADDDAGATEDTVISPWNDDAGKGLRTRLTFNYAGDLGGVKFRFNAEGEKATPTMAYAYGWANFLEKKIVVYGGNIGDDLWGLGKLSDSVFHPSFRSLDAVNGVRAAFNVVDGLSFGVSLPSKAGSEKGAVVSDYFTGPVIGALYKSDVFSIVAAGHIYPEVDTADYGGSGTGNDAYADIIAGIEIAFAPVNVIVDARFDTRKNDEGQATGYTRISPLIRYIADPITAHVLGDISIPNGKGDSTADNNGFNADHYDVETAKAAGDTTIRFRLGLNYAVSETLEPYIYVGSDNVSYFEGNGVYAQLGAVITLGSSSIEIFEKINGLGAKEDEGKSPIANQVQIDFNWSF
jgi:hypothetical protein